MPVTTSEDRQKAIASAMSAINKEFGKNGDDAVMVLGDHPEKEIQTIPSGLMSMDIALGSQGWPKGRIIEVYGQEATGKTLLTEQCIAAVQREGGIAAFLDVEQAFNPGFARKLGVDTDSLIFSQPSNGEEAFEILEKLIATNSIDVIVVDSISALVPIKELEGNFGDATMGAQARMISQGLRKITGLISKSNTTVFFINQMRMKIGVTYGSPWTTTGGNAMKFYASVRIEIARTETLKEGTDVYGQRTRAKVVKNKIAAPHKQAEYDLIIKEGDEGISWEGDIRDLGVKYGLITKAGSFFTFPSGLKAQGGEKARIYLKENHEEALDIEKQLREIIWPNGASLADPTKQEAAEETSLLDD